jgi:hypothetical protein
MMKQAHFGEGSGAGGGEKIIRGISGKIEELVGRKDKKEVE